MYFQGMTINIEYEKYLRWVYCWHRNMQVQWNPLILAGNLKSYNIFPQKVFICTGSKVSPSTPRVLVIVVILLCFMQFFQQQTILET